MQVEMSLASLLEKLKVEDPWLPPRTWESIPSQSGRSPPPSRVSAASSSSSSVSESSLVRLAINALQGVESALISIEKLSSVFCSEPADRTFHKIPSLWTRVSSTDALGQILRTIGYFGSLVFLLHKFVDHFTSFKLDVEIAAEGQEDCNLEHCQGVSVGKANEACKKSNEDSCFSYSIVNQAYAIAVRKVLEGYTCALDTLCASVELRRSSSIVERSGHNSSGLGFLTNVVNSKITLLEIFLHTRELRTQIEALVNICGLHDVALSYCGSSWEDLTAKAALQFHKFFRGGNLLTYLCSQLKVADPAHRAMLKFLFLKTCEPYCRFIRSWIYKAQINDPYREFIVEGIDEFPPHSQSKAGISPLPRVREREGVVVPCFLKGFLVPLVRAGQQLQVVIKLLELCNLSAFGDHNYADLLPCWTHYSSTSGLRASPITFSKKCIEALEQARDKYYRRMHEKLGDLSKKLELFSKQAVGAWSLPMFYCDGGNINSSISFTLDDSMVPSTAERDSTMDQSDLDSDDRNKEDRCFLETGACDSSDCSSTGDSEEATEAGLLDLHGTSMGSKQNYLSALSFSIASADYSGRSLPQFDKSCHVDSHFTSKEVKTKSHGQLMDPKPEGSMGVCMNNKCTESLSVKPWPLGGLSRNPFYSDKENTDADRAYPFDSGAKMGEVNAGNIDESMPFLNNIPTGDNALKEKREHDWPENSFLTDLSLSKDVKVNYPCNVLGMSPVLMKTALFRPISKHQDPEAGEQRKSLLCFDFSVVDDPCRVCFERLSVGSSIHSYAESKASLTNSEYDHHANQERCGDKFVVKDPELSFRHLPSGLKGGAEEDKSNATGGSRWESLLSRSNYPETITVSDCWQDSFCTFELPLDVVIDKCLLQEVLLQYNFVSKLTITLLEEGFGLQEHLLALRRYHFMELADWADLFIMSLWHHKWLVTEADERIAEIQGLLESSIQRSSCENDSYKDRLFVYMKRQGTAPLPSPAVGVHSFDFLGLGYRVDWPVSIILTSDALKAYADVFSFLIQVKLAAFSLTDIWCSLKDVRHMMCRSQLEITKQELRWINILMKLRHQVNHFVSTLQQYVQSELSHVSWSKFLHSLKHKVKDMMDLESVHMAYVNEALRICFLSDETRAISSIIENILQSALDFRSCLPRGFWSAGQDQTDSWTKTLGVNTSQVMSIKQKFDKHIKELHLSYLRSPKHGEFRLSSFWGYLNFNQYYSEILNETSNFAFVV